MLGRKAGESIWMPHLNIEIRVVEIRGNTVRLGINAPKEIAVLRDDALDTRGIDLHLFTGATDGTDTDEI